MTSLMSAVQHEAVKAQVGLWVGCASWTVKPKKVHNLQWGFPEGGPVPSHAEEEGVPWLSLPEASRWGCQL